MTTFDIYAETKAPRAKRKVQSNTAKKTVPGKTESIYDRGIKNGWGPLFKTFDRATVRKLKDT